jgi:hypothetical protein
MAKPLGTSTRVYIMYSASTNYRGVGRRDYSRLQYSKTGGVVTYVDEDAARPDLLNLRELASRGRGLFPDHVIHSAWLERETVTREVIGD